MSNRAITSREYKLLLNADRLQDRALGTRNFFNLIKFLIERGGGKSVNVKSSETKRKTHYLDVSSDRLRTNGFILRVRDEVKAGRKFSVTLKYRGSDRYICAAQNLKADTEAKYKFEEDILPPFVSKYSHSTKIEVSNLPTLESFSDAVKLFPGLAGLDIPRDAPLSTVNGLVATEIGRKAKLNFGAGEADSSVSFWYGGDQSDGVLLVGEFAFDYAATEKKGLEEFPLELLRAGDALFQALQRQHGWFDFNGTTKTAYVYRD